MRNTYRRPGAPVALTGVFRRRVWHAVAATVVSDSADGAILCTRPGDQLNCAEHVVRHMKGEPLPHSRWEEMKRGQWRLDELAWRRTRVLWFLEPGKYYGISLFWDADTGNFMDYYVNFQRPYQCTPAGYDALDLDLDIIVMPDLEWRWKDEDDWASALASGALTEEDISGVEGAKQEVLRRIEADRLQEFSQWVDWEPLSEWPAARLPDGWDSVD